MALDDVLLETEEKMSKSVEVVKEEFASIRTGKASPDLVSHLRVDCYGTSMVMRELAAITTPEPRMLVIQPWDASNVDPVRKAIEESNVGITPMVDGKLIRLPIPELSEERRHDLVRTVKKIGEDGRVAIRASRRHAMDEVKKMQKAGELTEDDLTMAEKEIQKLTDEYVGQIDTSLDHKDKELMKV
ncbi:MAG: ribosome recycling factor [Verrucomicrobiota bacterium]